MYRHQILIGIAEGFGSSIPEPGHVHHEGMRLIRIGEMNGGITPRLEDIELAWRNAGFNVRAYADVNLMVWGNSSATSRSAPRVRYSTPLSGS